MFISFLFPGFFTLILRYCKVANCPLQSLRPAENKKDKKDNRSFDVKKTWDNLFGVCLYVMSHES